MQFCPRCGAIMQPKREGSKTILTCPRCGYTVEAGISGATPAIVMSRRITHTERDKTVIIDEEIKEKLRTAPKIKGYVICPKCGNDEAYYWMMQTRRADEPPTRFYKCTKCGYVWREYE